MVYPFFPSYIALWIIAIAEALLLLAVLQQLARLRELVKNKSLAMKEHLQIGSTAPDFVAYSKDELGIEVFDGTGGIILFVSSGCPMCIALLDSIAEAALQDLPRVIMFCQGQADVCGRFSKRLGPGFDLIIDDAEETAIRYHISQLPTAVVIDGQRTIRGYSHPKNIQDLTDLMVQLMAEGTRNDQTMREAVPTSRSR